MSKRVTCNTLVWLRDKPFEAGTSFAVVDEPKADKEVDPATASGWARNGWLSTADKAKAAGEGA